MRPLCWAQTRWLREFCGSAGAILAGLLVLAATVLAQAAPSGTLAVFHAGSLAVPMDQLCREFTRLHPGVKIQREADGSRTCARKISELGRACDVLAVADHRVIDDLLLPDHAAWNLRFASNELVLAMNPGQAKARGVTAATCFDLLVKGRLVFGRSDPDSDPCGYRSVQAIRLAGLHLKRPGLADSLLALHHRHIRPKEVDLLALLEMDEIEVVFIYRSVAVQHGLDIVALPPEINLGDPTREALYRQAWADVAGKHPGETTRIYGEAMIYGVTIPRRSPNPEAALAFVRFLLTREQGGAILARLGQPSVVPAVCSSYEALPAPLRGFAKPADRSR